MQTCLRSAARRRVMVIITALFLVLVGPWAVWAYIGELTYDGVVDDADLDVIEAAFGRTRWSGDPAWNAEADLNTDGRVDVRDLAIAGRSYGSDRNFHQPRRLSNRHHTTNTFDACLDGRDQLHIVWVEDSYRYLYYTRLDRYGNTLIDDVPVDGPPNNITMVAVGCGSEGNAHLIWNCGTGACQARFDRWGYQILPKMRVESRSRVGPEGNLAVDAQGRAHALYMLPDRETHVYAMLTSEGEKAISMDSPLLAGVPVISSRYRELAVDDDDNVHLIWTEEEGEDRLFYARLSADAATSISATVIGLLDWNGSVTTARRPSLALDGQGNAFVLWNGHDPTQLNLDKIGADGSVLLDDVEIFPEWKSGYHQDFVAGPDDQLHLLVQRPGERQGWPPTLPTVRSQITLNRATLCVGASMAGLQAIRICSLTRRTMSISSTYRTMSPPMTHPVPQACSVITAQPSMWPPTTAPAPIWASTSPISTGPHRWPAGESRSP
jgi:hypothetical protein